MNHLCDDKSNTADDSNNITSGRCEDISPVCGLTEPVLSPLDNFGMVSVAQTSPHIVHFFTLVPVLFLVAALVTSQSPATCPVATIGLVSSCSQTEHVLNSTPFCTQVAAVLIVQSPKL